MIDRHDGESGIQDTQRAVGIEADDPLSMFVGEVTAIDDGNFIPMQSSKSCSQGMRSAEISPDGAHVHCEVSLGQPANVHPR